MTNRTKSGQARSRVERDSMGEMTVPAHVLYGASTQRAVLNFPVSGRTVGPLVIHAFALLKKACAEANMELKKLDRKQGKLITDACDDIIAGLEGETSSLRDAAGVMEHFPIDIFQTGSGTSTNMNANEVIANLAARAS
ncbi:MAG: lyase family protein, partial [Planctomycetota bacterium]